MKKTIILLVILGAMGIAGGAEASIARELTYSENIVWRCAVRFLRVDSGFRVLEKDKETGYLLFEFTDGGTVSNGSLEVLRVVKKNREFVRVQMNLYGQPRYVESLLFNKLERKLKNEYGMAPAAKIVEPKNSASETDETPADGENVRPGEDASEADLEITEDDLNNDNRNNDEEK